MWYFHSPKIVFGEEALLELSQLNSERAYIVTDSVMLELGFLGQVQDRLAQAGIESAFFSQIEPDPDLETVGRCAAAISAYGPDLVIGLGGGSCLDAAKAAWFLYERPDVNLAAVNPFEFFNLGRKARLVCVPTTAGSGAEVTGGAVITDKVSNRKMEVPSYELIPELTVVDPLFSLEMPPQLTADTGIDVLAHAIEGYSSTFANDFGDALCLHAAWLVFEYLPRAYEKGAADLEAREKMANAATIAGLGVGCSHIALAHALGHGAGALFPIPHGRLAGLFLPYSIEFTANGGVGRYLGLARALGLPGTDESQAAVSLAQAVRDLLRRVELPLSLAETSISRADFGTNLEAMCDRVEMDSALATCRRFPYRKEIIQLYQCAYDGQKVGF